MMVDSELKNCPVCDEEIKAVSKKCNFCDSLIRDDMNEDLKNEHINCPLCDEEIAPTAYKCEYCDSPIEGKYKDKKNEGILKKLDYQYLTITAIVAVGLIFLVLFLMNPIAEDTEQESIAEATDEELGSVNGLEQIKDDLIADKLSEITMKAKDKVESEIIKAIQDEDKDIEEDEEPEVDTNNLVDAEVNEVVEVTDPEPKQDHKPIVTSGTIPWGGGTYTGSLKNGLPDGQGTWSEPEGKSYVGEFVEGKITGRGTMVFPGGEQYKGDFVNGKAHGYGIMTHPDGREVSGRWIQGVYQEE